MRVSDRLLIQRFLDALAANRAAQDRGLRQLADGKRVRHASDDPAGAATAVALRGRLVRTEGFRRSGQAAQADLATLDQTLGQIFGLVTEARTKALAGASSSNQDVGDELALEVDRIREQLIDLGNTYQNGRYLFAGAATLVTPFSPAGGYVGDDGEARAAIDSDRTVAVTLSGQRVFAGGGDILTTLSVLSGALRSGDTDTVRSTIDDLKTQLNHVDLVRAEVGTRLTLVDQTLSDLGDEQVRLQARIAEIEDVDIARVIVEVGQAETSFEALSRTGSSILGRSLFDFFG